MGKKKAAEDNAQSPVSVWLDDAQSNIDASIVAFTQQWIPWPKFNIGVEIMDMRRLRDIIGVRSSDDYGDPWPYVERALLDNGYRWRTLGSTRVMYVKERDEYEPDDGWEMAEES